MKLAPYPEYKESGMPWLGKMPAHWEAIKTKYVFRERVQKGYPKESLLAATQTKGVVPKSIYENRTVEAQKDLHLLKLVETGDFVISLRSFQGGIEYAYYRGIISPAYTVIVPNKRILPAYFRHLGKSKKFISLLQTCVTGIREGQNINYAILRKTPIPVPTEEEQTQIARFLDWKTAQINKFIRNKRRFIELLKEQKQNVINQAVTRGLDPKVKFKPSGVEWIGDIPEHWEACQLKRYLLRNDGGVWGSGFSEDGVIVFRSTEQTVDGQWRITDPARRILTEAERIGAILEAGDLLVTKSSGSPSHIGKTTLVTDEIAALSPCFSNFMQRLRVKQRVEPEYLWLYMNSRAARTQLQYLSNSTTGLGNLSESIVGRIVAFLPPKPEQLAILSGLKSEMTPIDTAIQKAENEIELMREYRTRLISDVVTGQVDVRNMKCEGGSLNEDEFEDIEEVEEEIELPEGGEDDE